MVSNRPKPAAGLATATRLATHAPGADSRLVAEPHRATSRAFIHVNVVPVYVDAVYVDAVYVDAVRRTLTK